MRGSLRKRPSPALPTQSLTVLNRQTTRRVNLPLLRRITRTLLRELLLQERFDLGICLVSAEEITRLNGEFLDHDTRTDVIAFDYSESIEGAPRSSPLHGEIFICVEMAIQQARRFRTSWPSELTRYMIHGVLHLLGFEDSRPADRQQMKGVESRTLELLQRRFDLERLNVIRP